MARTTSLESAVEAALSTRVVERLFAENQPRKPEFVGPEDRYQILDLVGGGSSGSVYRAIDQMYSDEHHDEIVAVKLLKDEESADEARKARYVRHENVVRSLDFGKGYVVFQYVGGGSLGDVKRPVEPRRAAELIASIADGVQAAHGQGLVHRDLKPGNVLLDESGTPKVADFGIALRDSDLGTIADDGSHPTGNRAFMAPELFTEGRGAISTQVDVYALGAMLYWLLTDQLPCGKSLADIERSHRSGRKADFGELPTDLGAICERAMAPDPTARYSSAAQLASDLRRFTACRPIEWTHPSLRRRAALTWARDPRLTVLVSSAVLLGLGSSATVGWFYAEYEQAEAEDRRRQEQAIDNFDIAIGIAELFKTFAPPELLPSREAAAASDGSPTTDRDDPPPAKNDDPPAPTEDVRSPSADGAGQ